MGEREGEEYSDLLTDGSWSHRIASRVGAVDAPLPGAAGPSDAGATSRAPETDTEVGEIGEEGTDATGRGGRQRAAGEGRAEGG